MAGTMSVSVGQSPGLYHDIKATRITTDKTKFATLRHGRSLLSQAQRRPRISIRGLAIDTDQIHHRILESPNKAKMKTINASTSTSSLLTLENKGGGTDRPRRQNHGRSQPGLILSACNRRSNRPTSASAKARRIKTPPSPTRRRAKPPTTAGAPP